MKKIILTLSVLTILSTSVFAQKLAYIFSEKILSESQEAIDASKEFDKVIAEMKKDYQDKESELRKLNDELEKQSLLLSPEKKAEKQAKMEDIYRQLLDFEKNKFGPGGEAEKKQNDLMKPIIEKVNKVVKEVSVREGFDFVLDASIGGVIVYAKEDFDITDRIIETLNKNKTPKTTK